MKYFYVLLGLYFIVFAPLLLADVLNLKVSTDINQAITFDLSNSITNVASPDVVIIAAPSNGTATDNPCTGGALTCVQYTPNAGFEGFDTIIYADASDITITATINISVGNPSQKTQGIVPTQAVNETLADICTQNPTLALCFDYLTVENSGSPEDLRELINALTPSEIAAQGTLSNELTQQQLTNIGKHLSALRHGQKMTAFNQLTLHQNQKTIVVDQIAQLLDFNNSDSGGAASADNSNTPWGWYMSGSVGGGNQDLTEFEDGFKFSTGGITTGVDYRIRDIAVVGGALGYAATSMDLDFDAGGSDANGISVIIYSSIYPSTHSYIDGIISSHNHSFDSQRHIVYGTTNADASSNSDVQTIALSIAGGYEVGAKGFTSTFEAKVEYFDTTIGGFSESGADPYNITILERDYNRFATQLGARLSYVLSHKWGVLIPQLDAFWVHQYEDNAEFIEGYFNSDPTKTPFRFNTNIPDTDYAKLELGASAVFPGGNTGFVQVGSDLSRSDFQNWHLSLGYRMEF